MKSDGKTGVDRLYEEFSDLAEYLKQGGEISMQIAVDTNFRKSLVMAAASYFEVKLTDGIFNFFNLISGSNELATSFVRAKAISRQYHSYFDWKVNNANKFFSSFGDGFKKFMERQIKGDVELESSIRAFIEIGNIRNRLAHEDFSTFPLEKSSEEIYQSYKTALVFVETFPDKLHQYMSEAKDI
jgi:hypothetical protein